jgi:hypothetical protein
VNRTDPAPSLVSEQRTRERYSSRRWECLANVTTGTGSSSSRTGQVLREHAAHPPAYPAAYPVRHVSGIGAKRFRTVCRGYHGTRRWKSPKGTGHHLGLNLVILRGHGFNSSTVPARDGGRHEGCVDHSCSTAVRQFECSMVRLFPLLAASRLVPAGPCLGARGVPTHSTARTRASISGYDVTAFPPAALIAKS